MARTVQFKWDGKSYRIPKMRLRAYQEFLRLQNQLGETNDAMEQVEISEKLMECLGCPADVIDNVVLDEFGKCLEQLSAAHFGATAGDSKNRTAAGATR